MAGIEDYLAAIAQPGVAPPVAPALPVAAPVAAPPVQQPGFLEALSNPTGNPMLMLDLASKLSRAPQPGQSTSSAVIGGTTEALKGHAGRKAGAAASALATRGAEADIATKERTLKSADLADELTEAKIRDLDEVKSSGNVASKVQEMNAQARTLLANHPDIYKDINEAREAAVSQDHFRGVETKRAEAVADYFTNNVLVRNAAEQKSDLAEINTRFDALAAQKPYDPIKPEAAATEGKPEQLRGQLEAMSEPEFSAWALQRNPQANPETIAKAYKELQGTKPKVRAKKKAKALPSKDRKARRVETATKRKTSKVAETAAVTKVLETSFKTMSKVEMRAYLKKNRKKMSSEQFRKYSGIMRVKGR